MEILNVIVAGLAGWAFGAIWYTVIGKQWMAASGLSEEDVARRDPTPFIATAIGSIVVAGMLRHILAGAGVHNGFGGALSGFGLGLFVVTPYIMANVLFGQRDRRLIWMDGAYPTIGMAIMGWVLTLF